MSTVVTGMRAPVQAFDRVPPPGCSGMLNDIWETPRVLQGMLDDHLKENGGTCNVDIPSLQRPLPVAKEGNAADARGAKRPAGRSALDTMAACSPQGSESFQNKFTIVGCGSSWHAALLGEYLIEHIARIPVDVQYASEFRHRQPLLRNGDVVLFISTSGETKDTLESLRLVKRAAGDDVLTIALVSEVESTIARESDAFIGACAGPEAGVASTKALSCTMLALVLLAVALGERRGTLQEAEKQLLLKKLKDLPKHVQEVLDRESRPLRRKDGERSLLIGECALFDIGCQNVLAPNFIFLGRGFNFPIALEGAMKCKEIAYMHAEGYPAAEMKHGPIALIDQFMPVVFIAPKSDPSYDKIKCNIEEVKARSGSTIAITEYDNVELTEICDHVIGVPSTHEYLMPLISVIPLQLLAYMMGVLRGNQVDNPRGLQKTFAQDE